MARPSRRSSAVYHPIFARVFDWVSTRAAPKEQGEHRRQLVAGLSGRVVEVGAGNGLNFMHYPATVSEVVAVEPEPYLRRRAQEAAAGAPVPVRVLDGVADALPLEAEAVDAGVVSLVLCSVPSQGGALAELWRVIRPGGELRFYEHVRAREARAARAQDAADSVWPRLNGGCHLNRDTVAAVEGAGFEVEVSRRVAVGPRPVAALAPHVLGTARRPDPSRGQGRLHLPQEA